MTMSFLGGRSRMLLLLTAIASTNLVSPSHLAAQSTMQPVASGPTKPPLRFDVVSVRPHPFNGDEPSDRRVLPGGRFVATATPLRTLLRIAFGVEDVTGAPGWVDNETFDIDATTANHAEIATPEQFQQAILSLLEDRFQLKFHREQKEGSVYWLELDKPGKLGPALKPSTPDAKPSMSNNGGAVADMKVSAMSMTDIAAGLRRQVGRPVEDHTDLKGKFDFQIEWAPDETPDATRPSLFTVLKEQLGLKLQSARGPVETIVIDQIGHPSAN